MQTIEIFSAARRALAAAAILVLVAACGGGGSGDSGSGATNVAPVSAPGTTSGPLAIDGAIVVAASNKAETAAAHRTPATAQPLAAGDSVYGTAAASDPSSTCDRFAMHDFYRFDLAEDTQVQLTIASDDLVRNDLDLYVVDANCRIIASSNDFDSALEIIVLSPASTPRGTYFAAVGAFAGRSAYLLSIATASVSVANSIQLYPADATIVPGEILVRYRAGAGADRRGALAANDLREADSLPGGVQRIRLAGIDPNDAPGSKRRPAAMLGAAGQTKPTVRGENEWIAATIEQVRRLRADPNVEFAEPNFILQPMLVPSDPEYPRQSWHYESIRLPAAWDRTLGAQSIVAVLDSGIAPNHPDFQGQLVDGYDFVSDPTRSGDGNGRDADPSDVAGSNFHGTHVAGTIAARSGDGAGATGAAPGARIMPLRVLAPGGGTTVDVVEAVYFAAGLSNSTGRVPARRADVINLSLGGTAASQTLESAIRAAIAQGVVVVAAAGNEGTSAPRYPAAIDGVISVAAFGPNYARAAYSNFGPTIDVAGPGGTGRTAGTGVWSTLASVVGGTTQPTYGAFSGTSMAAPHVSGVVALMKSVNRALGPEDVRLLLQGRHPNSSARITFFPPGVTPSDAAGGRDDRLGFGVIDAAAAVAAAQALAPVATGAASQLAVSTRSVTIGPQASSETINVLNSGAAGSTLRVTAIGSNRPWLRVPALAAPAIAPYRFNAIVDRATLPLGTTQSATITIETDAASGARTATIPVSVQVPATLANGDVGPVYVLLVEAATERVVAEATALPGAGYRFSFPAATTPPGNYLLIAGTDRDLDDLICDIEDACGTNGSAVTLTRGAPALSARFSVGHYRVLTSGATTPVESASLPRESRRRPAGRAD